MGEISLISRGLGHEVATSRKRKFTCQGQTSNGMPDAHTKVTKAQEVRAERNRIKIEIAASVISKNRFTPEEMSQSIDKFLASDSDTEM